MRTSRELFAAILKNDSVAVKTVLESEPGLAGSLFPAARLYRSGICHWLYAGDTALHLAAAGHRVEIVQILLAAGASPDQEGPHRRATPLHYAADGCPGRKEWKPPLQVRTIENLLNAGANLEAADKNGATPLHRAVRTRSAEAVKYLLGRGCDPTRLNQPGSTPFHLAVQNTGRGGSGGAEAKSAQREIIRAFLHHGLRPTLRDRAGRSVLDWARSQWIRDLLTDLKGHENRAE